MTTMTTTARNAAAEATALLGPGHTARTLEPSPPTVADEPFFADDPAAAGQPDHEGDTIITPTSGGSRSWDDVIAERPELADFARDHWLGNRGRLHAVPHGYPAGRDAYHRLAYAIVAEARRVANGKYGLRYTGGGYGTPFFGDDEQVRIDGTTIVVQHGDDARSAPITTVQAAAEFVGVEPGGEAGEHDSPELGDPAADLPVTEEIGAFLGDWFGFSWAVLEELRLTDGAVDVDRTQLWPGHFDPAVAIGDAEAGQRATYGLSPGDGAHEEPYLYVAAWGDVDRSDPYFNEENFNGASLPFATLLAAEDPYATAVEFFRGGHARLTA